MVALAQPGVDILEVAISVGFGSASAFSRTFAGCRPVEYRHRAARPMIRHWCSQVQLPNLDCTDR